MNHRDCSKEKGMTRREFIRTAALGGAAASASLSLVPGLSFAQAAQKGVWEMKYDCYIGKTAETARLDDWFLDEIVRRSDGRITVKKFWGGSLHKVGQHLSAVRDGLIEMTMIAWGYYLPDIPLSHGLEWYYRGCEHADSLLYICRDMYEAFPELRKEWEETYKSKVLYFTNWSYCPFFMKEEMPDIQSLKGRKIRGYGLGADTVSRLGGIGTPMAASEVYAALEKGTLNGVFAFAFVTAERMKIHEKAPYIVEVGAGAHAPSSTVMNIGLWRSLPDDLKTLIDQTAKEIYDSKYLEIYSELIGKSVERMIADGAKFSRWPDSEIEKAFKMVQPGQVSEWIEKTAKPLKFDGDAFQKKIAELIQKYHPGKLRNPWEVYASKVKG